ncbi:MAG: SGNH/GDSL hydrolase family protein [Bdellovibrionales bacterium]|nr:SGNH/GDSL hydrolase family protein [Bdellovibrionales bacterium]
MRFILVVLSILIAATFFSMAPWEQSHTLVNQSNWQGLKFFEYNRVPGGVQFISSPMTLADSNLNLNVFWGHQGLLTKNKYSVSAATLAFEIADDSYLDIYWNYSEDRSAKGIRLSRKNGFDSGWITLNSDESISFDQKIIKFKKSDLSKNIAKLKFDNDRAIVCISNQCDTLLAKKDSKIGFFGMRSGLNGASVKRIDLESSDGRILEESFNPPKLNDFLLSGIVIELCLVMIFLFVVFIIYKRLNFDYLKKTLQFSVCISIFIAFTNHFLWIRQFNLSIFEKLPSTVYLNQGDGIEYSLETLKNYILKAAGHEIPYSDKAISKFNSKHEITWARTICSNKIKSLCQTFGSESELLKLLNYNDHNEKRILFLGSSQIQGMGASHANKSEMAVLHQLIANSLGDEKTIVSVNFSLGGYDDSSFLALLKSKIEIVRPHIIVTNAPGYDWIGSHQETDQTNDFLSKTWTLAKNARANLVIQRTSFNTEEEYHRLPVYPFWSKNAEKKIPETLFFDAYLYFYKEDLKNRGYLWTDNVHWTDQAQRMVGEELYRLLSTRGTIKEL